MVQQLEITGLASISDLFSECELMVAIAYDTVGIRKMDQFLEFMRMFSLHRQFGSVQICRAEACHGQNEYLNLGPGLGPLYGQNKHKIEVQYVTVTKKPTYKKLQADFLKQCTQI